MHSTEEWRQAIGYEGVYEVSAEGNVRRVLASQGTRTGPLRQNQVRGYPCVNLCTNCVAKTTLVHRLVCEAFHGPSLGREVNHKDGDRTNNHESNLEWVTRSENNFHKTRVLGKCVGESHVFHGRVGANSHSAKTYVVQSPSGELLRITGLNEFCRQNFLTPSGLYQTSTGRLRQHKGWKIVHKNVIEGPENNVDTTEATP